MQGYIYKEILHPKFRLFEVILKYFQNLKKSGQSLNTGTMPEHHAAVQLKMSLLLVIFRS